MKQKYAVVFEQTSNNYSAYVPDLPGCVSTGESFECVQRTIREAISFHIEAMLDHGEPLPEPKMSLEDAEAHHNEVMVEFGVYASEDFHHTESELPAKFGMVEVETATSQSGTFNLLAQPSPPEDPRYSR